jgi:phage-related protein (TIGR01555 family)
MLDRIRSAIARTDSWINAITGIGGVNSKAAFSYQRTLRLPDESLSDIFHGDPFAAKICSAVPDAALRKGFTVKTGDPALESLLTAKLDTLKAREKFTETWTWARRDGGAALLLGADDGLDPSLPLDLKAVRAVRFLTVLTKRELQPASWYRDPLQSTFGEVETYRLTRSSSDGGTDSRIVHATRLIRFDGTLTDRQRRMENNGWAESELQRVYDVLQKFNGSFEATGTLLQDASQGVFKIAGLMEMIAQDSQDVLKRRLEWMDMSRSIARSLMIDKEEDYARVETTMAGLPDTLDRFMLLLSGASGIPVAILMGRSPAGLNATGESDTRSFYDSVAEDQTNVLKPRLERLVRLILQANGAEPDEWSVVFPSLYQMTPKEQAELQKLTADTDAIYITNQVLLPEEVAMSRFRPEGWSAETSIELDSRQPAAATVDPTAATEGTEAPVDPKAKDPSAALNGAQVSSLLEIVTQIGARQIPRSTGIGLITAAFPLSVVQAEAIVGEVGVSFFTTPDPTQVAELDSIKSEHAALTRSHQSTKAMLARVLERNKKGELVVGSPIAKAPTETDPGDVLEDGDVIAVPPDAAPAAPAAPTEAPPV